MNRLRSYLIASVLKGVALTLGVLVAVGGLIDFVGQFGDVGTGEYGVREAVAYVLLRMPRFAFIVFPAAALIGALAGLGSLAVHRELVVMRTSGVSPLRMLAAVALAGFGLLVVMVLLGESLAPSLAAYAREMRAKALHENLETAAGQSTWLKDGERIVNLRRPTEGTGFGGGVVLIDLDADQRVARIARAESTAIAPNDEWLLTGYEETEFTDEGIRARRADELRQDFGLGRDMLDLSVVRADLLATPALELYIAYLRANDLDARRYLIAYWARWANMASGFLMATLALPFVFFGLRSAGAGARLALGLVIGLAHYVVVQVAANSGEVFDLDPIAVAWGPNAALVVVTTIALLRVR